MADIRVYHGFRSPFSRLGLHVIKRAGLEAEVIVFTGPPEGSPFFDPLASPAKLAYYRIDAPRMTKRLGLKMAQPKAGDIDFAPANRGLVAAERDGKGLAFAIAVSDARWGEGEDVSEPGVLEACASAAGWSGEALRAAQEDASVSEAIRRQRALIEEDGVFGVPFAVMGRNKYWGHDRFALLVEEAGAA